MRVIYWVGKKDNTPDRRNSPWEGLGRSDHSSSRVWDIEVCCSSLPPFSLLDIFRPCVDTITTFPGNNAKQATTKVDAISKSTTILVLKT